MEKQTDSRRNAPFVQSQLHKATESEVFKIDYVFYKSKSKEDEKQLKYVSEENTDDFSPMNTNNMADHKPIKFIFNKGKNTYNSFKF